MASTSRMDGGTNARIKILVRVRPLNDKDRANKCHNLLKGDEQLLHVLDPAAFELEAGAGLRPEILAGWTRDFCFDRVLWPEQSTQETLFEEVGEKAIEYVMNGFNCCIFAFGQTSSGKTHSMFGKVRGDPSHFGLIPRICYSLFDKIGASDCDGSYGETTTETSVTFSHMEIYNEVVRDLLVSGSAPLRVREHPSRGVFVANLTSVRVTRFEHVLTLIAVGEANRASAATEANAHSSRSHAVVTLCVVRRSRQAKGCSGAEAGAGGGAVAG